MSIKKSTEIYLRRDFETYQTKYSRNLKLFYVLGFFTKSLTEVVHQIYSIYISFIAFNK